MQDSAAKARTRAPGLDGVRAIAVIAVMGYHESLSSLGGGFLGVDVFFVLSGFLITDLLAGRRPRLRDFWIRRVRRLLPPLAVMLLVVSAAATVVEPAGGSELRGTLLAAVSYTSNWYQILHHVSYFESLGPLPPLQHLWSLAIEEQFYLVWPPVLWYAIFRHNSTRARVTSTLLGALASAIAMAILYTPANPSFVYYGTGTHASALLLGSALALAFPLRQLTGVKSWRLDAAGLTGLVVLGWSFAHFTGTESAVYPYGLLLAAVAAAALVAAACSAGWLAKVLGVVPLRWIGVRSYAMYLWHWPVIALTSALTGEAPGTHLLWLPTMGVTVALAAASWRFIESPILRDGFFIWCRTWYTQLTAALMDPAAASERIAPATVTGVAAITLAVAGYGIAGPVHPPVDSGLLDQVAAGQRISAASQLAAAVAPRYALSKSAPGKHVVAPARRPAPHRKAQSRACPRADGRQVTAVGDSVMLASAQGLEDDMPGIYIDAKVGMQMATGIAIVHRLAAGDDLRPYVVVGLGTNGPITPGQIWQLRKAAGHDRELIMVNTYGPMSWEPEVNAVLAKATWHKPHVALADWSDAIATHRSLLWGDGIHPQPSGGRLYARVIENIVRSTC
ncbi:MAG TPA: acyltransferase family protein [Streptosporangiaceae bacterium]